MSVMLSSISFFDKNRCRFNYWLLQRNPTCKKKNISFHLYVNNIPNKNFFKTCSQLELYDEIDGICILKEDCKNQNKFQYGSNCVTMCPHLTMDDNFLCVDTCPIVGFY
jgi:hypothetical protein